MLAKAAAHASVPVIRGSIYLDAHDAKIIQYKAAIYKLGEMTRLLSILEKNLEKSTSSNIIPLVNYMLSLCEGPMFSIHSIIRKRYQLLCEYKVCKVTTLNPALSTSDIMLEVDLPQVQENLELIRGKIYDRDLQWKLLGCLQKIIVNSSSIYERRLRQVQIERNAIRPTDAAGRPITFDINSVQDLLRPWEASLCLDLAVLINDQEQDTTIRSLRKLQTQVLLKFAICLQQKVLPVIRGYYGQLQKFVTTRGVSQAAFKELQFWEYSIHRIYALFFRILYIFDVTASLMRQIYLPNKSYLTETRTKLLSQNVFTYQDALQKVDVLCYVTESDIYNDTVSVLQRFSKQGSIHHVQPGKVLEIYQNSISQVVPFVKNMAQQMKTFADLWKFIESNSEGAKKIDAYEKTQLLHMLEERMAVDKLAHVENLKSKKAASESGSSLKGTSSGSRYSLKRNLAERVSGSSSSSVSSSTAGSPGKLSPLRMSRTSSTERGSAKTSNMNSPQVSRRGSIAESRIPLTASLLSKAGHDQKNGPRSPLSSKKVIGRPRSSSLQSPLEINQSKKQTPLPSRSNSLQAGAALNQKMIQDAARRSTSGSASSQTQKGDKKTGETSQYPLANNSGANKNSSESSLPAISSLSLNPKGDQLLREDDTEETNSSTSSSITVEAAGCVKRVRFTGVPPMRDEEERSPTRRGWYKKPAVLHYPPPPPQFAGQKYKMRQEGMAFRTSLRETDGSKKSSLLMNMEVVPPKESSTQRLATKIRDKLR